MRVIKRNGSEVDFDLQKIISAIKNATLNGDGTCELNEDIIHGIAINVETKCSKFDRALSVEEIQEIVESSLIDCRATETAKRYIRYRYQRSLSHRANTTDDAVLSLLNCENEEVKQENSNKNPTIVSVQRDYMAGEVSKDITKRLLLPEDIVKAHEEGIIHFHDADYFAVKEHNCDLVNLEDMLQNGTVISGTKIDKPHSFSTACNIATQIIAQVASCQYGGQSITLTHLAPFVDVSRQRFRKEVRQELTDAGLNFNDDDINKIAEMRVKEEIKKGVQTIQYQVVTLMTTNGQAPFITVFMYLDETDDVKTRDDLALIIEEVLKQRIQGVKNDQGVYITPAFPKLIYVLDEDNITPNSKYWYLTELSAKCTAKRLVPDYLSAKIMKKLKVDSAGNPAVYPPMGCRSILTPYCDTDGKPKYYGRFNQGVVTINLPDVACSVVEKSNGTADEKLKEFWKLLEERLELCHRALRCRHERLKGTLSDVAPILWQHGAISRLKSGETIDKLLYGGYSTLSLGFAGLWECVYELTGEKLTSPVGEKLGLEILEFMTERYMGWRNAENIYYSLYGTPLESTTYKFAKTLQSRFGKIKGVTDKNYVTNSYHIHVTEEIDAFSKLAFESKFQDLSAGGAISYVEVPDMQGNIPAVLKVMQFIYNTILYAELNCKSDYCQVCGFDGEIKLINENHKLIWQCPICGCKDQTKMNVARRTCGYIGTQYWNQGRTQEIKDRVLHL